MSRRRAVLAIIKAIGGDPEFWGSAETCQPALEKAEAIITDERMEATQFCHEWYAVRWARLRDLIRTEARRLEDAACCIMANATADPNEPPTYDQILSEKYHEIARLRKERDSLVSVIENLWQHAEPSIRAEDIREQIACVLFAAGNARREENLHDALLAAMRIGRPR